jgi:TPR repeat protein
MTTRVARASMCALVISLAIPTPATARGPDPTSAYKERSVLGFTVLVNRRVLEHKEEAAEALKEVNAQLGRIARVVPPKPLAKLRKVRIWVEWANSTEKLTEFHPSAQWLRENGYNPEKAGGVEVANALKFTECSRDDQPWALMHEMAHAYQFRVLGEDHPAAQKAYRKAMESGLYESVAHVHGGTRKAYAATNYKEYFADLTEAYFGKNDFFPFERVDLKKYDPTGYRLMQDVWGQPSDVAAPSRKR